jgi:trans-aconitate 2-methyltransferase
MTSPSWDPTQYLKFGGERARPFADLVARITVDAPAHVVDLGCGPGNMTGTLLDRWPAAQVHGIDSSAAMLARARPLARPGLSFALGDIADWQPDGPLDVIVSNAALQWVPGHLALLPRWLAALRPGGALAFQVPANVDGAAVEVFRTVAGRPRWASRLAPISAAETPSAQAGIARQATEYVEVLGGAAATVDAWETTYLHVLPGADPVLEWYAGTGLRPYTDALVQPDRDEFIAEVAAELRAVFPRHPYGTVLPFHRVFVIAYAAS